jgi:hypothetical protein
MAKHRYLPKVLSGSVEFLNVSSADGLTIVRRMRWGACCFVSMIAWPITTLECVGLQARKAVEYSSR